MKRGITFLKCAAPILLQAALLAGLNAQTSSLCSVTADFLPVRAEGHSELVGAIRLHCQAASPNSLPPRATIIVSLSPSVVWNDTTAFLIPAIPTPAGPQFGSPLAGVIGDCNNRRWPSVSLVDTILIENIRVNARALPINATINATVALDFPAVTAVVPPVNIGSVLVAIVQPGMSFSVRNAQGDTGGMPVPLERAVSLNRSMGAATSTLLVSFAEGFSSSFKRRNIATSPLRPNDVAGQFPDPGTETGYYDPSLNSGNALARSGTRLAIWFNSVPEGVSLFVTVNQLPSAASPRGLAQLLTTGSAADGPFQASQATAFIGSQIGVTPIPVVKGTAFAAWEILASDPSLLESFTFGIVVSYDAGMPSAGTASLSVGLAPAPGINGTSAFPRFSGTLGPFPAYQIRETRPAISSLDKTETTAGAVGFTVVVNGAGFFPSQPANGNPGSVLHWNGALLLPTFLSGTQLQATVPGNLLASPGTATLTAENPGNLMSNAVRLVIHPPPQIVTGLLPDLTAQTAVNQPISLRGGTPPFSWTHLTALPNGLILTDDGRVVGAATVSGRFEFVAQVTDSQGVSASRQIAVVVTARNRLLMDVPPTVHSGQRQTVYLRLESLAEQSTEGRLQGIFTPHPKVQLPSPSTPIVPVFCLNLDSREQCDLGSVLFTLPAAAAQGISHVFLIAGNVAGELTLSIDAVSPSGILLPAPVTVSVPPEPPALDRMDMARSGERLLVRLTGLTNTREVSRADFRFQFAGFPDIDSSVDVMSAFRGWFGQASQSEPLSAEFCYLQQFRLHGDMTAMTAVSVKLHNEVDDSQVKTYRVPEGGIPEGELTCPIPQR